MRNPISQLWIAFSLFVITLSGYSQDSSSFHYLAPNKFPPAVHPHAKTVSALQWSDKDGEHTVTLEQTGNYQHPQLKHESEGLDAELFGYHECRNSLKKQLVWKLEDYIYDCPVDLEAVFMKNMPVVTDLDHDSLPEIWIMYQIVCHGDVSPRTVKIIMYEGDIKYAVRGESRVFEGTDEYGKMHYLGGTYKYDSAFAAQPLFLSYGDSLWKKYVLTE